jgi:hypothetical protein
LLLFSAGNQIPNRSATQIAVPKQGQVGEYANVNVSAKHCLPLDNSREQYPQNAEITRKFLTILITGTGTLGKS